VKNLAAAFEVKESKHQLRPATTNKMAKDSVPKFFYDAIYSDLKNFALDSFF
jgi:hypothetical protein